MNLTHYESISVTWAIGYSLTLLKKATFNLYLFLPVNS